MFFENFIFIVCSVRLSSNGVPQLSWDQRNIMINIITVIVNLTLFLPCIFATFPFWSDNIHLLGRLSYSITYFIQCPQGFVPLLSSVFFITWEFAFMVSGTFDWGGDRRVNHWTPRSWKQSKLFDFPFYFISYTLKNCCLLLESIINCRQQRLKRRWKRSHLWK